jgi:hypothetical protein
MPVLPAVVSPLFPLAANTAMFKSASFFNSSLS